MAAVAAHVGDEDGRQAVDAGDANAVQAAGDLVGRLVELAARVQDGERHGEGRLAVLRVQVDGDTAAVVVDPAGPVLLQDDCNAVAMASEGLVDGVVDDLVDEVVQAAGIGRPDVHGGALADGLQALEDLDGRRRVVGGDGSRAGRLRGLGHENGVSNGGFRLAPGSPGGSRTCAYAREGINPPFQGPETARQGQIPGPGGSRRRKPRRRSAVLGRLWGSVPSAPTGPNRDSGGPGD